MSTPPADVRPVTVLRVDIDFGDGPRPVGRLGWRDRRVYFGYDEAFVASGLDLSPFRLRLEPGVKPGPVGVFDGLPGVFNDSLPDGWGRLLMDRKLRGLGLHPGRLTPLDRLAWVGRRGMGALVYQPEHAMAGDEADGLVDLDRLADESLKVLDDEPSSVLDELLRLGGSAQGARPKALVGLDEAGGRMVHGVDDLPDGFRHWLVKFRAYQDPIDAGAIEYAYALMAGDAGIAMPPVRLFPSRKGPGFFGAKRFDRDGNRRRHMHTISGLLNADHAVPSIGYTDLLKATRALTRTQPAVDQVFLRMVFNVLARNQDDHTKNHAFLMDESGVWIPSPAYDLTFAAGPGGEQALDVAGNGRNPGAADLRKVAAVVGVPRAEADLSIERVRSVVERWPEYARNAGVAASSIQSIDAALRGKDR